MDIVQKKVILAIPTYWIKEEKEGYHPGSIVYDHPTLITEKGTLHRLLRSFERLKDSFEVLIMVSSTDESILEEAEEKLLKILSPFKSRFPIILFGRKALNIIREEVKERWREFFSLKGYGNVRNIGLIVAQILDFDIVISLDDDEIIIDEDFIKKGISYIGKRYNKEKVLGIAGYYIEEEKREKPKGKNLFYRKRELINSTLKLLLANSNELCKTSLAFGGNMVIAKELFKKVPFDPFIPRGEDIDYLINAKLLGFSFYFNKELNLLHKPPYSKPQFLQDIVRFIYEREKIILGEKFGFNKIEIDSLKPYPGDFLDENIEEIVKELLVIEGVSLNFLKTTKEYIKEKLPLFFDLLKEWNNFMEQLSSNKNLKDKLRGLYL